MKLRQATFKEGIGYNPQRGKLTREITLIQSQSYLGWKKWHQKAFILRVQNVEKVWGELQGAKHPPGCSRWTPSLFRHFTRSGDFQSENTRPGVPSRTLRQFCANSVKPSLLPHSDSDWYVQDTHVKLFPRRRRWWQFHCFRISYR